MISAITLGEIYAREEREKSIELEIKEDIGIVDGGDELCTIQRTTETF